ncbi:MAG: DUF1573 domain-containing protein [Candidatus Peregrinibacteria bacterium]|nr:DUF1573 domain-containing protein [Candidatus Peregrinibacteria bacterium]
MKKDTLSIISAGLTTLVLILAIGMLNLAKSNSKLRTQITQSNTVSQQQISEFKAAVEKLQQKELTENQEKTVAKNTPPPEPETTKPPTSEEDLVASLFPQVAELKEISEENEDSALTGYLSINPETYDFGQISKKGGVVSATFTLQNQGDRDLLIKYALTSCGCTVAPLKDEVTLKPGQSMPLDVEYDPNFYGPNLELGEISKTVTVLSNDPVKPFYKVYLKAYVLP